MALGGEFKEAAKVPAPAHAAVWPSVSDVDPLAHGAAESATSRFVGAGVHDFRPDGNDGHALSPSMGEDDQELVYDEVRLRADIDTLCHPDLDGEDIILFDDDDAADAHAHDLSELGHADDEAHLVALIGGDIAPEIDHASASSSSDGAFTPLEVARTAYIDEHGWVRCPTQPWASMGGPVGRLTTWPLDKPLAKRSVGMRCYMHPRCSRAVMRTAATDLQLLEWLFNGRPLPLDATEASRVAAHDEHMVAFYSVVP